MDSDAEIARILQEQMDLDAAETLSGMGNGFQAPGGDLYNSLYSRSGGVIGDDLSDPAREGRDDLDPVPGHLDHPNTNVRQPASREHLEALYAAGHPTYIDERGYRVFVDPELQAQNEMRTEVLYPDNPEVWDGFYVNAPGFEPQPESNPDP